MEDEERKREQERETKERELEEELIITKAALARAQARAAKAEGSSPGADGSSGAAASYTPSGASWAFGPDVAPAPGTGTGNTTAAFESAARSMDRSTGGQEFPREQRAAQGRTPSMTPLFAAHSAPLGRISGTKTGDGASATAPRFGQDGGRSPSGLEARSGVEPPARRSLDAGTGAQPPFAYNLSSSGGSQTGRSKQGGTADPDRCDTVESVEEHPTASTVGAAGTDTASSMSDSASKVGDRAIPAHGRSRLDGPHVSMTVTTRRDDHGSQSTDESGLSRDGNLRPRTPSQEGAALPPPPSFIRKARLAQTGATGKKSGAAATDAHQHDVEHAHTAQRSGMVERIGGSSTATDVARPATST